MTVVDPLTVLREALRYTQGYDVGRWAAYLRPSEVTERHEAALAAVEQLVAAAGPLARLPYPLTADERKDWLTYRQHLRATLARFEGGSQQEDGR